MEVVRYLEDLHPGIPSVVTIGVFDGLHLGHQLIMQTVTNDADALGVRSVAITFDRNPQELVDPTASPAYISTLQHKLKLIERQGIDLTLVLPLDRHVVDMSADEFVSQILVEKLSAVRVVVGWNFAFGRGRKGTVDFLKREGERYGFEVVSVPPVKMGDVTISSTVIRRLIANGNIDEANIMLGRPFILEGKVVSGDQIGSTIIGFPTANLVIGGQVIPRDGVYIVKVLLPECEMLGVLDIGNRPTVSGKHRVIEVHIIGFSGDLYGQDLRVAFHHRLRDEMRFESIEALKRQIARDVSAAESWSEECGF